MRLFLITISFFTFYIQCQAQVDNNIVIGRIDSISSKILNETRKIWIYVPTQKAEEVYSKKKYPVVYLLDGDAHFFSVVGMIQQLSSVNGNMICPEMIVVGIPNTNRTRDLTPSHVAADLPNMDSNTSKASGGGETFISFIEKELMPYVDAHYPTEPYKIIIGHSLGGLMVMQALVHHPSLFNSYICIDPSMWWDNQKLLKEAKTILAEKKFEKKSMFLGIANTLDDGMDLVKVQRDTSATTKHIRSILALSNILETNKQNGLKFAGKYYVDDDHGSVPLIAEYDALHFMFDYYPLKLQAKDYLDSTINLADKYENHFANISLQMGYSVKPPENTINSLSYDLLGQRQIKKAEECFKLNVDNYPDSYNVFDSYGDFFVETGDRANAIVQFKKALLLKENKDTRMKLKKLQGQ